MRRRDLLSLIGAAAGGAAMYQAMTSLGFAAESPYRGPIKLEGDPKGASVIILGAGLAGMTAAYRTRPRRIQGPGPRIQFPPRRPELVDPGRRLLHRARRRDAAMRVRRGPLSQSGAVADSLPPPCDPRLLPQVRRRARAVHPAQPQRLSSRRPTAFGGKPQRIREIKADFEGAIAELLAKATRKGALDDAVSKEDQEILLEALRAHGGLDKDFRYQAGDDAADFRGYARDPGGGLDGERRRTASRSGCTIC